MTKVDFSGNVKNITIDDNTTITADAVIVSTGQVLNIWDWLTKPNMQDKGISACATCDGFLSEKDSGGSRWW